MTEWSNANAYTERQQDDWWGSPLGQYLLVIEQRWFAERLQQTHGWITVQLGFADINLARFSRARQRLRVANNRGEVRAEAKALPFSENSIDTLILPHALDFNSDPRQVLREAHRVLAAGGQLLLSGFNPWSLWGLQRMLNGQQNMPWVGNFISLRRLHDWLTLLNFHVRLSATGCYIPPLVGARWRQRFRFLEGAGERWWPFGGAVYFLQASKQVYEMRLIRPIPFRPRRFKPRLATAYYHQPPEK